MSRVAFGSGLTHVRISVCPQTSKIKRFLLSLRFNFSTSIYLKREICIVVVLQGTGYTMVSLVFLQLLNNARYLP